MSPSQRLPPGQYKEASATGEAEKRRIQNRIAQRNYRNKLKKRLEDLERKANAESDNGMASKADVATRRAETKQVRLHQATPSTSGYGDQNPPCNTLYLSNLPPNASEIELKALMVTQNGYKRMCFRTKQNGPMCFVEFDDISSATKALHELYGYELSNSNKKGLRISFSKNPLGVRSGPSFSTSTVEIFGTPRLQPIKCTCGVDRNEEAMLQCESCGTWQHVNCYTGSEEEEEEEETVEVHQCQDCAEQQQQKNSSDSHMAVDTNRKQNMEQSVSDRGLRWIVCDNNAEEFKSKEHMHTVRQAAMASYLRTEKEQENKGSLQLSMSKVRSLSSHQKTKTSGNSEITSGSQPDIASESVDGFQMQDVVRTRAIGALAEKWATVKSSRRCIACRERHIRCDGATPKCGACLRLKTNCTVYRPTQSLNMNDLTNWEGPQFATSSAPSELNSKAKRRVGRRRLPPLALGPALQFVVANHPDDFKAGKLMSHVRSHIMYKNRENWDTTESHESNPPTHFQPPNSDAAMMPFRLQAMGIEQTSSAANITIRHVPGMLNAQGSEIQNYSAPTSMVHNPSPVEGNYKALQDFLDFSNYGGATGTMGPDLDGMNVQISQPIRPRLETSISPKHAVVLGEEEDNCLAYTDEDRSAPRSKNFDIDNWTEASAPSMPFDYHFVATPLRLTPQHGRKDNDTVENTTTPGYDMFATNYSFFVDKRHTVTSEVVHLPLQSQENSTETPGYSHNLYSEQSSPVDHKSVASSSVTDDSYNTLCESDTVHPHEELVPHVFSESSTLLGTDWEQIRDSLPDAWKWDVEYSTTHADSGSQYGSWSCTPLEQDEPKNYPLTIANSPVVFPIEHQWPPTGGVTPPPDPRPSEAIDCRAEIPLSAIRDIFLTFEGSIGFYLLVNGLLQVIVPNYFDTNWASSHFPHKYGGLKVCYIKQTLEPTMMPTTTETSKTRPSFSSPSTGMGSIFKPSRQQAVSHTPFLKLNDFIEARPRANHRKDKYSGRIGLKVAKDGEPYVLMSTHVITEAILAKSHRDVVFGRSRNNRFEKLEGDWDEYVEIWAGNEKVSPVLSICLHSSSGAYLAWRGNWKNTLEASRLQRSDSIMDVSC
jgi:hypothetical protein